jgi:uncharacterized membrane protein
LICIIKVIEIVKTSFNTNVTSDAMLSSDNCLMKQRNEMSSEELIMMSFIQVEAQSDLIINTLQKVSIIDHHITHIDFIASASIMITNKLMHEYQKIVRIKSMLDFDSKFDI